MESRPLYCMPLIDYKPRTGSSFPIRGKCLNVVRTSTKDDVIQDLVTLGLSYTEALRVMERWDRERNGKQRLAKDIN